MFFPTVPDLLCFLENLNPIKPELCLANFTDAFTAAILIVKWQPYNTGAQKSTYSNQVGKQNWSKCQNSQRNGS